MSVWSSNLSQLERSLRWNTTHKSVATRKFLPNSQIWFHCHTQLEKIKAWSRWLTTQFLPCLRVMSKIVRWTSPLVNSYKMRNKLGQVPSIYQMMCSICKNLWAMPVFGQCGFSAIQLVVGLPSKNSSLSNCSTSISPLLLKVMRPLLFSICQ